MIDVAALVARGSESKDLDYKGPMAWNEKDKKACCEIVKDCLAMANTGGGYLVIGIREDSSRFSVAGLSRSQASSWDTTRLNNFIRNYSDPPINTTMKSEDLNGQQVVAIAIPSFRDTPHVCKRDFPTVLRTATHYVRTDANASEPLGTAADAHALIELAVRQRADQLLQSIHLVLKSGLTPPSIDDDEQYALQISEAKTNLITLMAKDGMDYATLPLIHTAIYPSTFDSDLLPLRQLRSVAQEAATNLWGWPVPFVDNLLGPGNTTSLLNQCIQTYYVHPYNEPHVDYWRLYRSGLLIHSRSLYREVDTRGEMPDLLDLFWIAGTVQVAAACLVRLLRQYVEDVDYASLDIEVVNADGSKISQDMSGFPIGVNYVCREANVMEKHTASLAEWRASWSDYAADMTRNILLRFQFDRLSSQQIKNGVQKKIHVSLESAV